MRRAVTVVAWCMLLGLFACGQGASAPSGSGSSMANSEAQAEGAPKAYPPPAGSTPLTSCPSAAAHVYHPARLRLLAGCQEAQVSGVIESAKAEPDGDFHVRLKLDPGQAPNGGSWTNVANDQHQAGDLVLEPVCMHGVTQADAVSACAGYVNPLRLPKVGTHVIAHGYWVFDAEHGWQELHPLTKVVVA